MKGENDFMQARLTNARDVPRTPGTFYGSSPWKRIIVALAGPAFNLLFALVIFSCIWWIGFSYYTSDNRIVLASEFDLGDIVYPADRAGLQSGDYIVEMGDAPVGDFRGIREAVVRTLNKSIPVTVVRNSRRIDLQMTPEFDAELRIPRIGVYPWIEPFY